MDNLHNFFKAFLVFSTLIIMKRKILTAKLWPVRSHVALFSLAESILQILSHVLITFSWRTVYWTLPAVVYLRDLDVPFVPVCHTVIIHLGLFDDLDIWIVIRICLPALWINLCTGTLFEMCLRIFQLWRCLDAYTVLMLLLVFIVLISYVR